MGHGDLSRLIGGALLAMLLLSGCSDDGPEPEPQAAATSESAEPAYDATLEPSAAVLALVPEDAETLAVTDFDQVRAELGMDELTDQSTPEELAAFWQRATAERPLLSPGMLRSAEQQLATTYGFTQLDVAWEAHFFAAGDQETGWVLRFRDTTDMAKVTAATEDAGGPLSGADVDAADHLVSSGTTDDPTQSWAAAPDLEELVGLPANATYVSRSCVHESTTGDVDDLAAYSVQFEGSLATARLGEGRQDLFARMRLGESEPTFTAAYDGGVADPVTGRIGYVMTDPAAAAGLALTHQLPFASCP
ncbi:MAG: hypothetical protein QOD98_2573 [Nocardioidaceae bacterium]|nr:hypothetical protein [Nocardioidaceae bacterium]